MKIVHIEQAGRAVAAMPGETILQAARSAGIEYPFSCQSGRCGACKSRLLEGEVEHVQPYSKFVLTEQERMDGVLLACRSLPKTNVKVAWLRQTEPRPSIQKFVSSVSQVIRLTHDIVRLQVPIPEGLEFRFFAGQFALLRFEGMEERSYSMANISGERVLEFFIRKADGGRVSTFANERLVPGTKVSIEGPFGDSFLQTSHTGPILAVAGGSGLAPIHSIIRTALSLGMKQRIYMYFGVREDRDVYFVQELQMLKAKHPNFSFHVVVEKARGPSPYRVGGRVGSAVSSDWPTFTGAWQAYLAGPPPMVEGVGNAVIVSGISALNVFADPFHFSTK